MRHRKLPWWLDRKKRSTVFAVAVLTCLAAAVFVNGTVKWLKKQAELIGERTKTQQILDDLAQNFADNNERIIVAWAKGEIKDVWGNDVLLEDNEEYVRFSSKGRDGVAATADDLFGEAWRWQKAPVSDVEKKAEEIQKKVEDKAKSFFEKAKNFKFEFKWGKEPSSK